MLPTVIAWGLTLDLGLVLLLAYVLVLWLSGWLLEFLARAHFHRAQRYAHTGFAYDAELDRYECPQGELLTLHTFDDRNKLAIYKAPASTCNECVLKAFCAPHDAGRHVLPLAGRVSRDGRRPVSPLAFVDHPRGGAGVLGGGRARPLEQAGRVAARGRHGCQSRAALARLPRRPQSVRQRRRFCRGFLCRRAVVRRQRSAGPIATAANQKSRVPAMRDLCLFQSAW